ncbi:MAG: hypothetical protein A3I75_07795 [Deltaproteobacteria bacterium RIFCSPLOWO2_02_FULL_50_16]|nr:MAG: hypothetical protein A3I75_07795 [Deltaproteobacteria bacterium RIFCSPLOWO2_02_FULL_50_16]OGQ65400.1 MAG: hypothetical protein A3F89_08475 [Deltaproteobacteria bacterium RIFCSPLOWO2_12_FULL_50_11]
MIDVKKKFSEMSVLFPLLAVYTITYLGLMIYDFVAKEAFEMPAGMMGVYTALLLAYATDKEIRRWLGKEKPSRYGSYFVYLWFVFFLVAFVIQSFKAEYTLPKDLIAVVLEVLAVFFGSKASKKVYEMKQGQGAEALSREEKVLSYLKEHKEAKNNDFQQILGASESTVRRILNTMESKGLVEQHGDKKATTYTLSEKE